MSVNFFTVKIDFFVKKANGELQKTMVAGLSFNQR